MMLHSSLHIASLFLHVVILFTLKYNVLRHCSYSCDVAFLFTCCCSPLHIHVQGPLLLLFFMLLPLCYYSLRELVLSPSIPSYRLGVIENQQPNKLFSSKFFFIFFPHVFCSFLKKKLFMVCGVRLVFGNKHKPFKNIFLQFCIFVCL